MLLPVVRLCNKNVAIFKAAIVTEICYFPLGWISEGTNSIDDTYQGSTAHLEDRNKISYIEKLLFVHCSEWNIINHL